MDTTHVALLALWAIITLLVWGVRNRAALKRVRRNDDDLRQ